MPPDGMISDGLFGFSYNFVTFLEPNTKGTPKFFADKAFLFTK